MISASALLLLPLSSSLSLSQNLGSDVSVPEETMCVKGNLIQYTTKNIFFPQTANAEVIDKVEGRCKILVAGLISSLTEDIEYSKISKVSMTLCERLSKSSAGKDDVAMTCSTPGDDTQCVCKVGGSQFAVTPEFRSNGALNVDRSRTLSLLKGYCKQDTGKKETFVCGDGEGSASLQVNIDTSKENYALVTYRDSRPSYIWYGKFSSAALYSPFCGELKPAVLRDATVSFAKIDGKCTFTMYRDESHMLRMTKPAPFDQLVFSYKPGVIDTDKTWENQEGSLIDKKEADEIRNAGTARVAELKKKATEAARRRQELDKFDSEDMMNAKCQEALPSNMILAPLWPSRIIRYTGIPRNPNPCHLIQSSAWLSIPILSWDFPDNQRRASEDFDPYNV